MQFRLLFDFLAIAARNSRAHLRLSQVFLIRIVAFGIAAVMSIAMTDALAAPVWSAERRKHRAHHLLVAGAGLVLIIRGGGSRALDSVIAKEVGAPKCTTASERRLVKSASSRDGLHSPA